jgi:hypothetical protein
LFVCFFNRNVLHALSVVVCFFFKYSTFKIILYRQLKQTRLQGQTGQLRFNEEGDRLDAMYEIININTSRRHVAVGFYGGLQVSPTKVRVVSLALVQSACSLSVVEIACK